MRLTTRHRDGSQGLRRAILPVILVLGALGGPPARSEADAIRIARLALNGYDPVSYFLPEGPQAGSARFEADWNGQVWRFASEADRAAFRRDPAVYAPRLGGYDAAAILDRRLADADPTVFALLDDRLYLFRDEERRARFLADPALAQQAEAIFPTLGQLLEDPQDTRQPKAR